MSGYLPAACRKNRDHAKDLKLSISQKDAFSSEESFHTSSPPESQYLISPPLWSLHPEPPEVTLSAFTETGQPESSIPVLKQRWYTDKKLMVSSTLANTPCAKFGVGGILERFDAALRGSCIWETNNADGSLPVDIEVMVYPSSKLPHSIIEAYIERNKDFGTAFAYLLSYWYSGTGFTHSPHQVGHIREHLRIREEEDREMRRKTLVNGRITSDVPPRRVWDLRANRVVPWYWCVRTNADRYPWAISHAWVNAEERMDVWTPINGYQWPVPIPKDANLDLIRIELLNLGADYVWLDVLCLRQPGGQEEHLRRGEWKIDVPTIGGVYRRAEKVVCYFSGLGLPLSFKAGNFESDRCWFSRAWTLQETTLLPIIGGQTGTLEGEVVQRRFSKRLQELHEMQRNHSVLHILSHMQNRVSTNPVDRVAGLAYMLDSTYIPTYDAEQSEESAWVALTNAMAPWSRAELFFFYPGPGKGGKHWCPLWNQAMTNKLPFSGELKQVGNVGRTEGTDIDWHEGPYIDSGYVKGLADMSNQEEDRQGELIIQDHTGVLHTCRIVANHQYPIPEGWYVLLGAVTRCDLEQDFEYADMMHWVVGGQQDGMFTKWSVFRMADVEEGRKVRDLEIANPSVKTFLR